MLDHVGFPVSNFLHSRKFYERCWNRSASVS